jgi:chromosome partitioning protein
MKTRIISLTNNKGGVGKTTSSLNIGVGLARKGKQVLLIDLDPQASLTISLGINPNNHLENSIVQVLTKKKDIKECILKVQNNVYLIPSNSLLNDAEPLISAKPYKETILQKALEPIKEVFNYIIIDCPPSLNTLTNNGLGASNEVFIPIEAEYLALQGTSQLVEKINEMQEGNEDLEITGVFLTKYDQRKNLNKQVKDVLIDTFKDKVFKTDINTNVALAEAPSHQKDIFTYEPTSSGARDYENLVNEIIKQED